MTLQLAGKGVRVAMARRTSAKRPNLPSSRRRRAPPVQRWGSWRLWYGRRMDAHAVERADTAPSTASTTPPRSASGRARWAVGIVGAALLVAYHNVRLSAVGGEALNSDLGIQHYLGRITSRGAIPLIDFEHGWNTASWYFNAALHQLSGDNPTVWLYLWGVVFGPILAGIALLAIAGRLRLPAVWMAALLATWVATTHLPHSKYATPMVWALILLPVGVTRRMGWAVALRMGMVATVYWFHVELAVLLGAGTAMYDVFGARRWRPSQRLLLLLSVGGGLLLGMTSHLAVYAALGLPPSEVLGQILFGQTDVHGVHFGYPLGAPPTFRILVYPASLVLPFVPAVWRRLSEPTRFIVFLHLSQALVPIRRPGDGHVGAAGTLLALVAVLVIYDVAIREPVRLPRPADARGVLTTVLAAGLGAGWFAVTITAGFRVSSLAAIVLLTLGCLAGVVAAARAQHPWASAGALTAAGALMVAGLVGYVRTEFRADAGLHQAQAIAEAVEPAVVRCAPEGEAWIVPSPLMLYETLDVKNPTRIHLFWYTFAGDQDRVRELVEAEEIPTIIQPYGWPEAMEGLVPFIESRYELCEEVMVESTGNLVRFWRLAES